VKRLNAEIVQVLGRPDVKEKFLASGDEAVGSPPEALAAVMKSEMVRMGRVIKEAGIRED
jgi:tripartite-type tricarboxylate transporter receptor subunit TctC